MLPEPERTGEALPLWTYASGELLELEYQESFSKGWPVVGHVCDLQRAALTISFWICRAESEPRPYATVFE